MANVFTLTPTHWLWNVNVISYIFCGLDILSIDLTEYGIPKPKDSVFKSNVFGNLFEHRINCLYDWVIGFDEPNIVKIGNRNNYNDSVTLATGYKHGLDKIFNDKLYGKLFEESKICKNWGIRPTTNGLNQSTMDNTMFFVGLLLNY